MNKSLAGKTIAAVLLVTGLVPLHAETASPFRLSAAPGFRLVDPSYRAAGGGMAVSVEVCRLVGWAGSVPAELHVERAAIDGVPGGHHDISLGRMGLRGGENCERATTRFDGPPHPGEHIALCVAYRHRRCD